MDHAPTQLKKVTGWKRWFLIGLGWLAVGVGIFGVFVPLLPTTPFLLVAAACFIRTSEWCYHWLLTNRWFGTYLRTYLEQKKIPRNVKVTSIIVLWIMIGSSMWFVPVMWVRVLLFCIAVGVSWHILSIETL